MSKEQLAEESMINIAYAVLTEKREALTLQQLMDEIRKITGITEKQMKAKNATVLYGHEYRRQIPCYQQ